MNMETDVVEATLSRALLGKSGRASSRQALEVDEVMSLNSAETLWPDVPAVPWGPLRLLRT